MNKNKTIGIILVLIISLLPLTFASKLTVSDSLESATGEHRVDLLLDLCADLVESDPVQTVLYAKEVLEIAQSLNLMDRSADAYNYIGYAYFNEDLFDESLLMFREAYTIALDHDYILGQAFSKNGYGLGAYSLGDYSNALKYFDDALNLYQSINNTNGLALASSNKGSVYESLGNYDLSLDAYLRSYKLFESSGNREEFANTALNIGFVYEQMHNRALTTEYYERALTLYEVLDNKIGIATAYNNFGNFFKSLELYSEAQKSYLKALDIFSDFDKPQEIASVYNNIAFLLEINEEFEDAMGLYNAAIEIATEIQSYEDTVIYTNNVGSVYNKLGDFENALLYHHNALELAENIGFEKGLESSIRNLAMDYERMADFESSNYYYALYAELKDRLIERNNIERFAKLAIAVEKEQDVTKIEAQNEALSVRAKQLFYSIVGTLLSLVILAIVSALGLLIARERKKSEKLLLNILPLRVANELKATGKTIPESFDDVTVYFSDIVNFTNTSANLDPKYLINELSDLFTTFDEIMENHDCERIKTIGDAYFAVCGLPEANPNHVENIINASMDILDALHARNSTSEIPWRIRIGIHTGSVTGGVVGTKKYIYDVFGDTINTASRMESNSEPMRINVSDSTYELAKSNYSFTQRELIEVKGKGHLQMYFLETSKK